ncbi:MAG TPA: hypothetical protein VFG11_10515 [Acidobacteriota bacterium]|nr:hypothetical protein [Acidobacteriota bacterium]
MRALYVFGVMMLGGVLLMLVSSYKLLTAIGDAKLEGTPIAGDWAVKGPVMSSYMGIGLFLFGALGAIVMIIRGINRR